MLTNRQVTQTLFTKYSKDGNKYEQYIFKKNMNET